MAPKLTSCGVFGMLLKYWLSTECGFVGGQVNPVGVLVSGGLLCEVEAWLYGAVWAILVPITCWYLCC